MPPEKRKQVAFEHAPREKRARQQSGYYSALLSYGHRASRDGKRREKNVVAVTPLKVQDLPEQAEVTHSSEQLDIKVKDPLAQCKAKDSSEKQAVKNSQELQLKDLQGGSNTQLKIKSSSKQPRVQKSSSEQLLQVQNTSKQVKIKTTSKQVKIKTTSKQVKVETTSKQLKVETTSKQLKVETTSRQLKVKNTSKQLRVRKSSPRQLRIKLRGSSNSKLLKVKNASKQFKGEDSSEDTIHSSDSHPSGHQTKSAVMEILNEQPGSDSASSSLQKACVKEESLSSSAEVKPETAEQELPMRMVHCGSCYAPCAGENAVRTHMKEAHSTLETAFCCDMCCLVFPWHRALVSHLKMEHMVPGDLSCLLCGKGFQCESYLLTHMMRHAGVKRFACEHCGSRFFERHKLWLHQEQVHKPASERLLPYFCELCGKQFPNKSNWVDHNNSHMGIRLLCDICGATFAHRVGLRKHKVNLHKSKPFPCLRCNQAFVSRRQLRQHMDVHVAEATRHQALAASKMAAGATPRVKGTQPQRDLYQQASRNRREKKVDSPPRVQDSPAKLQAKDCMKQRKVKATSQKLKVKLQVSPRQAKTSAKQAKVRTIPKQANSTEPSKTNRNMSRRPSPGQLKVEEAEERGEGSGKPVCPEPTSRQDRDRGDDSRKPTHPQSAPGQDGDRGDDSRKSTHPQSAPGQDRDRGDDSRKSTHRQYAPGQDGDRGDDSRKPTHPQPAARQRGSTQEVDELSEKHEGQPSVDDGGDGAGCESAFVSRGRGTQEDKRKQKGALSHHMEVVDQKREEGGGGEGGDEAVSVLPLSQLKKAVLSAPDQNTFTEEYGGTDGEDIVQVPSVSLSVPVPGANAAPGCLQYPGHTDQEPALEASVSVATAVFSPENASLTKTVHCPENVSLDKTTVSSENASSDQTISSDRMNKTIGYPKIASINKVIVCPQNASADKSSSSPKNASTDKANISAKNAYSFVSPKSAFMDKTLISSESSPVDKTFSVSENVHVTVHETDVSPESVVCVKKTKVSPWAAEVNKIDQSANFITSQIHDEHKTWTDIHSIIKKNSEGSTNIVQDSRTSTGIPSRIPRTCTATAVENSDICVVKVCRTSTDSAVENPKMCTDDSVENFRTSAENAAENCRSSTIVAAEYCGISTEKAEPSTHNYGAKPHPFPSSASHPVKLGTPSLAMKTQSSTMATKFLSLETTTSAMDILSGLSGSSVVSHASQGPQSRVEGLDFCMTAENEELELTFPEVKVVRCGLCDVRCVGEESVRTHMMEVHASLETAYSCDVCELVFAQKRSLLTHLKTVHRSDDLTCLICGKGFQYERYLLTHLQRHAGVKNFECEHCGLRFFERHKLLLHLELHKRESERQLPYRCELCSKQFANKASWSDHNNTHSGNRPFGCDLCGATFAHRVGLRRHKLIHQKVKPFCCQVCDRTFAVKPKLDEHMTTHTGLSRHTCLHCSKVFTAASSLKRHMAKCPDNRAEPRVEEAPQLTVDVAYASDLSHLSERGKESEGLMYVCAVCQASFPSCAQAQQHVMTHELQLCGASPSPQPPASLLDEAENSSSDITPFVTLGHSSIPSSVTVANQATRVGDIADPSEVALYQPSETNVASSLVMNSVQPTLENSSSSQHLSQVKVLRTSETVSKGALLPIIVTSPVKVGSNPASPVDDAVVSEQRTVTNIVTTAAGQGSGPSPQDEPVTCSSESLPAGLQGRILPAPDGQEEGRMETQTHGGQVMVIQCAQNRFVGLCSAADGEQLALCTGQLGSGSECGSRSGCGVEEGREVDMSVAEMEQIQLAADTLAKLSTM